MADVSGGTRLQFRLRPPLYYRQGQQASVPDRHGFRPLRVPAQAHPPAQVTSRLRPLRCQWHYHLHIRMAITQPQLGITPGLHVAIRGGGRLATPHRSRFCSAFRPLSWQLKQPPAGRRHVAVNTCPNRQPSDPSIKLISTGTAVDSILSEFPDLTRPTGVQREVRHNTVHHTRTASGQPVTCRPRRLAPDRLAVAKAEFEAMVRDGTACRSESSWSSALHLVPKKDNSWRPCGDYRALNARTIPDRYPVPHIHDYSHQLSGCRFYS
jgi:hypothetical protein